jgi:predicted Zn-dependent peptidase
MALCVCGDVTPEQVEAVCAKVLKPAADISISRMAVDEPEHVNQKRVTLDLEVAQPLFSIGIKDVPAKTPEQALKKSAANDILLQLLFGKSSDFYNRHYESG